VRLGRRSERRRGGSGGGGGGRRDKVVRFVGGSAGGCGFPRFWMALECFLERGILNTLRLLEDMNVKGF